MPPGAFVNPYFVGRSPSTEITSAAAGPPCRAGHDFQLATYQQIYREPDRACATDLVRDVQANDRPERGHFRALHPRLPTDLGSCAVDHRDRGSGRGVLVPRRRRAAALEHQHVYHACCSSTIAPSSNATSSTAGRVPGTPCNQHAHCLYSRRGPTTCAWSVHFVGFRPTKCTLKVLDGSGRRGEHRCQRSWRDPRREPSVPRM